MPLASRAQPFCRYALGVAGKEMAPLVDTADLIAVADILVNDDALMTESKTPWLDPGRFIFILY